MPAQSYTRITNPGRHRALLLAVPVLLVAILFIDSEAVAAHFAHGRWLANILTLGFFLWMLRAASPRLRRLMLIGVGVATAGEVFFSLILGMYEYRLENIPLYVPPGHCILYATIFLLGRDPWVIRNRQRIIAIGYAIAAAFSLAWLLAYQDVFGFICFGVFSLLIYRRPDSRLFFVTMYLLVAYLELLGTFFQCWHWPPYLLHLWPNITSANPPSGIAIFYMGFDIGCLGFYRLSKQGLRQRHKAIRKVREMGTGTQPSYACQTP